MKPTQRYAVTITAREQAELLAAPLDEAPPGPGEVAGSTLCTLISAGTELASAYTGQNFPAVPGYAAVFRVEEIGSAVGRLKVGDTAFCMGPHVSYQRQREVETLRVPDGLPPEKAVFARLMGVSMSTLTTTAARPPEKVVVAGLGAVGHLAAKNFAASGYDVMGCDPVLERRQFALAGGIRQVRETLPLDDPSWAGKTALVVECSGHEASARDACRLVQKGGEVVLIGTPWKRHTDITAHELLHAVFHQYVHLRSGWEWELPLHAADFRRNSVWGNLEGALRWLAEGRVDVAGLGTSHPPSDCQGVYQDLLHGKAKTLAAVFDWR